MAISWDNGTIRRLSLGAIKGIDWGAETADRKSFFTLAETSRCCEIRQFETRGTGNGFTQRIEAKLAEGHWVMDRTVEICDNRVHVSQELCCLDRSVLVDFVVRFKFSKDSFTTGTIDGRTIDHRNRNVWYQFPVDEAILSGPHGRAVVRLHSARLGGKFHSVLYIRDEPGAWIVHVRLLPSEPADLYMVRWYNRIFRFAFGDRLSRLILNWEWFKRRLWFLAERRGGRPAIQAQPLALLEKGTKIGILAECSIEVAGGVVS
jgi:hypothetical protein